MNSGENALQSQSVGSTVAPQPIAKIGIVANEIVKAQLAMFSGGFVFILMGWVIFYVI